LISTSTISSESNEFKEIVIPPKPIRELYVEKEAAPPRPVAITNDVLDKVKCKVKPVRSWMLAWKSEGSGARHNVSVSTMQTKKKKPIMYFFSFYGISKHKVN
jgi:hypothetical protein